MTCSSCAQKDAEIYRLSLVEARVQKLEAENLQLQNYADFDKTYAGRFWDLVKGSKALFEMLPDLVDGYQVALEWEKLTGSREPYKYLSTRAAKEWPLPGWMDGDKQ